ncbi:hypothetical protein LCGC14_2163730, partial [marine sediment metagenome]
AIQKKLNAAGEDQEKIAKLTKELEQAVSALAAATLDADAAMEGLGKSGKGVGEVLTKIALAVRGITRIADAFGIVNDDVRRALDSVLDLINAFSALKAAKGAMDLGTMLGLAGGAIGAISAIGGLFGGKDPAEIRREQERLDLLRANNLALAQLRLSFEKSLSVLGEFTGAEFARAQDLITQQISSLFPTLGLDEVNRITEEELAFLQKIADGFDITLDLTIESFEALREAIAGLDLSRLTETFTGAMDLMQRRFAIFDVDKPVDKLIAMLGLLEEFGDLDPFDLVGLPDAATEAGRAALEGFIKSMFAAVEAGTFDVARLGGLTLQDFLNLLASMEGLLDEITEEEKVAAGDEGLTESFVRTTRITEVQGNELLTLQRTMMVLNRMQLDAQLEMVNLLAGMVAVSAPAPSAPQALAAQVPVPAAAAAEQAPAPVIVGGVVGVCACVGVGCTKPGIAYNYVGSSSWIALTVEKPVFDEQMRTMSWAHAVPGYLQPSGTMQTAGSAYNWLKNEVCKFETSQARQENVSPYELMDRQVESAPPGANGLLFLPYLLGERSPRWNPDAKGAFVGLNLSHHRADMLRAVLEGITYNLELILAIFRREIEIDNMIVIGGGAKGAVWRQMMADIYNLEVRRPNYLEEATS